MPRRKSGIGRQPGDDFGKFKKPQDINEIRPSSRFSFRVPKKEPDLTQLDDQCGFEDIQPTGDLLSQRGRQTGELVLYDPIQQKNYLSQYQRYEAALDLEIHSIVKLPSGRTAYRFCSKRSPIGYWEVQIGGATFVQITKPILTIICPQPFKLADVQSGIETDDTSLVWEQIQGRNTIISPAEGEGSLDPTFVILPAARDPLDPPILIRVSLSGDPSIGDTLAIRTTATSTQFGIGSEVMDWGQDPCRAVPNIFFLPSGQTQAIAYTSQPIRVGWLTPTCGADQIVSYTWQANTTGEYVNVQNFLSSDPRMFVLQPNVRYRIVTMRSLFGIPSQIDSQRFQFTPPVNGQIILADERTSVSSTAIEGSHIIKPYALIVLNLPERQTGIGATLIETRHETKPYAVIQQMAQDRVNGISSTAIEGRHMVTQTGGIIIG